MLDLEPNGRQGIGARGANIDDPNGHAVPIGRTRQLKGRKHLDAGSGDEQRARMMLRLRAGAVGMGRHGGHSGIHSLHVRRSLMTVFLGDLQGCFWS